MRNVKLALVALSLAALLAACGGGDEGVVVEEKDPSPSGQEASITVLAADDADLNGIYSTDDINLNNVTKVNPIGGDPETCRFKFDGPEQAGSGRIMGGDIRYIPGTENLHSAFIAINGVEFELQGTTGVRVDRANDEVDFTAAVLTSTQGSGDEITLTGSIPMRPDRPEGC
ncbi:MAG TPA: hypothetical protein VEB23_11055 [Ramlibacter sp.]|nr:hypothetical protein [Ramlibacter sp.]